MLKCNQRSCAPGHKPAQLHSNIAWQFNNYERAAALFRP